MNNNQVFCVRNFLLLVLFYSITFGVIYLAVTTKYVENDDLTVLRISIFFILFPIIIKYIIQLLAIPFYSLSGYFLRKNNNENYTPKVSVLIPAWNEEVGIIKTIESVLNTEYGGLEVIVINDGSTDATHELVTQFITHFNQEKQQSRIKYLSLSNGGKAKALNQAIERATGEFIVTIDADCVMDKNALVNIVKHFADAQVAAVAGNVVIGNRQKPIELIQQLEYLYGFFFKRADSVFNSVYIIGGASAAYRKTVLDEVGGLDHEVLTEDIEMSTRILAAGYKTRYAYDAITYTEGPSDWKGLCNQRLRWKFGRFQTFIKYRQLFFSLGKKRNPYFTCLLLPIAVYAEFTLLFQGFFLAIFYGYTIYTNDYLPLVFVIFFMTLMILLQVIFDAKSRFHLNLLLLAPIAWIVLYAIDLVEFHALCRSLKCMIKQEELHWQKWVRVGLIGHTALPTAESIIEEEDVFSNPKS
jgi:biofilm PGA synthesis N-glycosyltransferase PgaC